MDRESEVTMLRDRLDVYSPGGGKWSRDLLGFQAVVDFNLVMASLTVVDSAERL